MRMSSQRYRLKKDLMLKLQHLSHLRTKLLVLTLMLNPVMQVRTYKVNWLFLQSVVTIWLLMAWSFTRKQLLQR